ncbi:NAD-dependent protein deacylase [Lancefieldella parvula]|uniref:NAD-dependent protein deacylase n=1 Tax=Lancefieldella parvula TaxID=1382 RepID=UPI0028D0BDF5|nr:NAD-dependent protein deacylase [Lancefieldella parvula]
MTKIEQLKDWIQSSDNIVFFGGAGVSTESGIPDFRGTNGLYRQGGIKVENMTIGLGQDGYDMGKEAYDLGNGVTVDPDNEESFAYSKAPDFTLEEIFSLDVFFDYPAAYYTYFRNSHHLGEAQPNIAHKWLADLEAAGKLRAVVTQNIDGLHQAAGSKRVFELHGNETRFYCPECGHTYTLDQIEEQSSVVPLCQCGAVIRPDIVFYGEGLDMDTVYGALNAISQAEVLVVAGSSLVVQPAAGLLDYYEGNKMAIINDQPTPYDNHANLVIRDRIGAVIEQLL